MGATASSLSPQASSSLPNRSGQGRILLKPEPLRPLFFFLSPYKAIAQVVVFFYALSAIVYTPWLLFSAVSACRLFSIGCSPRIPQFYLFPAAKIVSAVSAMQGYTERPFMKNLHPRWGSIFRVGLALQPPTLFWQRKKVKRWFGGNGLKKKSDSWWFHQKRFPVQTKRIKTD